MKILLDRSGSPDDLSRQLAELNSNPAVAGILVFACDGNEFTPEGVNEILRHSAKPLIGGVFPQIVFEEEHLTRGTIAVGLPAQPKMAVISAISASDLDMEELLDSAFPPLNHAAKQTMIVFADGFSSRIGALIDSLFNTFGLDINYLGGGCGSLSLVQKPCVISNQGLLQDAAVLALLDMPSGIGVAHGWQPISHAYKVTESEGNIIRSLDWLPAYQVYREVVEAHSTKRFEHEDFFSIAKAYPFGIAKLGTEMVVRDPLMRQGDALVCVGEVPTGTFVRILNGDKATLLKSASEARDIADRSSPSTAQLEIFIDCVSRVLFLEDSFSQELAAAKNPRLRMVGALTIGEIANSGSDYLEFYNKTAVVGQI